LTSSAVAQTMPRWLSSHVYKRCSRHVLSMPPCSCLSGPPLLFLPWVRIAVEANRISRHVSPQPARFQQGESGHERGVRTTTASGLNDVQCSGDTCRNISTQLIMNNLDKNTPTVRGTLPSCSVSEVVRCSSRSVALYTQ